MTTEHGERLELAVKVGAFALLGPSRDSRIFLVPVPVAENRPERAAAKAQRDQSEFTTAMIT